MKIKKILVTGGARFIGSFLVDELNKEGLVALFINSLKNNQAAQIYKDGLQTRDRSNDIRHSVADLTKTKKF